MTQNYVTTNIVRAHEAQRGEERGYTVNTDGNVAWIPEDEFAMSHLPMGNIEHLPGHVQRLMAEDVQLSDRCDRLAEFIASGKIEALDSQHRFLLHRQHASMMAYRDIVKERVALCLAEHEAGV